MSPSVTLASHVFDATYDGEKWVGKGTDPGVVEIIAERIYLPFPLRMSLRVTDGSLTLTPEQADFRGADGNVWIPSIQHYRVGVWKGTRVAGEIFTERCVEPFGGEVLKGMIIIAERETQAIFERVGRMKEIT